jgi:uncharacterized membrane protein
MPDKTETLLFALRWFHIAAGITWIGLLYFFNLVNGPFAKTMDGDTKKKVVPELMPRALWWFRWGAMVTFLAGLLLFTFKYMHTGTGFGPNSNFSANGHVSDRAVWILLGMLFGSIMWFNVWFVIWPAQRKLIGWLKAGEKNPAAEGLTRRAFLVSRTNTYLSGPMLVCMIAPNNAPSFSGPVFLVTSAVALGVVHLAIGQSGKVSAAV